MIYRRIKIIRKRKILDKVDYDYINLVEKNHKNIIYKKLEK